jgi:hypothetical protein
LSRLLGIDVIAVSVGMDLQTVLHMCVL